MISEFARYRQLEPVMLPKEPKDDARIGRLDLHCDADPAEKMANPTGSFYDKPGNGQTVFPPRADLLTVSPKSLKFGIEAPSQGNAVSGVLLYFVDSAGSYSSFVPLWPRCCGDPTCTVSDSAP